MRISIAQLNLTIGDLAGNVHKILAAHEAGRAAGATVVVTPEQAIVGYPARDFLDQPSFIKDAIAALGSLTKQIHGPALITGAVVSARGDPLTPDHRISNGAVLIEDGRIRACHRKILLPTYDVFDEARYFVPGEQPTIVSLGGVAVGLTVCEDIWNDKDYWQQPRYARDPAAETVAAGAELLVNISASPYDREKPHERIEMLQALARRHRRPVIYVNQVGGNDSLIFDGRSVALNREGALAARAPAFAEAAALVSLTGSYASGPMAPEPISWEADVTDALCLGLTDYLAKCGFRDVVLGLSGGIDSALVCALAVRALGPEHVIGVAMPSRYTAEASTEDAAELARALRIRLDVVPIEPVFQAYLSTLAKPFAGLAPDVTEENLQARIRGAILMAYSNKLGALLLTTGNKSELAVGYCTLYGDMAGGLALISDLYKTDVYAVARFLNRGAQPPIPERCLTRAPSAELRANQTDQDSLPPYDDLDRILRGHIDRTLGREALIAEGNPADLVERVVGMVSRAEYKRRQMPPGLRVSRKAFGEGRRIPVAQRCTRL